MRILVIHHSLNPCGGAERVCLHVLKLLVEKGFETHLATTEPTDWERVRELTGISLVGKIRELSLSPVQVRKFAIYHKLVRYLHVRSLFRKYDLVINTHADVLAVPCHIAYMHFPTLILQERAVTRTSEKYYRSIFWRLYYEPYRKLIDRMLEDSGQILITNSSFSRYMIRKLLGTDPVVVYPPVNIDKLLEVGKNPDREDSVIFIARYSPEKGHELVLQVAKHLPDVKFIIMGTAHGKALEYYRHLQKLREKLGLKNVELLVNVPEHVKIMFMSLCKVYLHVTTIEHFGISVVEALACGLVPIVHVASGSWIDICQHGKYGLAYVEKDPRHIAEKVQEALEKWDKSWIDKAQQQARQFSVENFRKRMWKVLEVILERDGFRRLHKPV